MRTTIDLPDDLFQQAQTEARRRGISLRELLQEGLRQVLPEPTSTAPDKTPSPSLYDLMKSGIGIADSGIDDLGSNPEHLKELGRDAMGDH